MIRDPEYDAWLRTVPADITDDPLWRMSAYRFALYAMSRAQFDVEALTRCRQTRPLIDQLLRAVAAISANLEERYGRSGGKDRAHFFEYALSTAREARGWYVKCTPAFSSETLGTRLVVFTQIIRILTAVVPRERESTVRWRSKRSAPPPEPAEDSSTSGNNQ
jgi:four helix bundle protein